MQDNFERKQIKNIDFNIDLAQSFGIYKNNAEFDLLDYASSVNISCGFHAGDPLTIRNALLKAKEKNVVVGAHIGFDDIQGFGYRDMNLDEDEIEALIVYQVGALMSFAKSMHLEIEHVLLTVLCIKSAQRIFHSLVLLQKLLKNVQNGLFIMVQLVKSQKKQGN